MRRLAIPLLSLALLVAPHAAFAAGKSGYKGPTVLETFSKQYIPAGRRETVHVQVVKGHTVLMGTQLTTVRLYQGARVLLTAQGGKANKKGIASATFRVPRKLRGKLTVYVVANWRGHAYQALSWINVLP
ncbi:MAG TPA: hypothetical protein VFB58_01050 [Chloroflexota bacterium]|nr:hypothetical protein [Chloroflexota bacterium]